jgi:hypothetical protein
MPLRMAAFRSRFRPRPFCFAHTAILELPRSTILVAGYENWGESRDVIRNSLSRRFFFCKHECSPSISATARPLFFELSGGGWGKKVSLMPGCGRMPNSSVVCPEWLQMSYRRTDGDDACSSTSARIILRCPTSCIVFERWRRAYESASSRDSVDAVLWRCLQCQNPATRGSRNSSCRADRLQ